MTSYVGHAFQACHVFELVMWSLQTIVYSYWKNIFRTIFASGGKIDTGYQMYIFITIGSTVIQVIKC